jgi:hypothetical protein
MTNIELQTLQALGFDMKKLSRCAKNVVATPYTGSASTKNFKVDVPGDAAILLGCVVTGGNDADQHSLKVNNETVYSSVPKRLFDPAENTIKPLGYFDVMRKLNEGGDSVQLTVTSAAGTDFVLTVYYLTIYQSGLKR